MIAAIYLSWLTVFGAPQHEPAMWFYDPYKIQTNGVLNEYEDRFQLDNPRHHDDYFLDDFVRALSQRDGVRQQRVEN